MKINSKVFAVIAVSLVAIVSYYMGVCGRTKNTVIETEQPTQLSPKNVTEIPNQERSDISSSVANQTEAIEAKPKPKPKPKPKLSSLPEEEVFNIPTKQTTNQPIYDKYNWPSGATGYVYAEDKGYTWIYTDTNKPQEIPEIKKSQISQTLVASPKDALEDFNLRYKLYQDMAKMDYEKDMANAGAVNGQQGDPILVQSAQQKYALNMTKINTWNENLEGKFKIIHDAANLTESERESIRLRLIIESGDPIHTNYAAEAFATTEKVKRKLIATQQQQKDLAQQQQRQRQEMMNRLDDIERQQRWNDMERDNWQLKYNYLDNKWQYAPPNSQLKYNSFDNSWQYVPSP
ncbi:MAG: hypothetical protein WAK60_06730 [Sedimentisphaerales bacterium]